MFRTPSIRRKLLYLVLIAVVPLALTNGFAVAVFTSQGMHRSIAALEARTQMLHDAVDAALRESIVGYLSAKTETALSTIASIDRSSAEKGEDAALEAIEEELLAMTIADSGYVYVIDRDGHVIIHPDPQTQGRFIPHIEPVRTQIETRDGYLEYTWQNSFEPLALPKALHMAEYPARGWIVSSSAYREEFIDLVDRDRLERLIESHPIDENTYSIIIGRDGEFIVHAEFAGRNVSAFFDTAEATRFMNLLFTESGERVRYLWPDPETGERQPKLLVFRYMPDFDWSIATTINVQALYQPILLVSIGAGLFLLLIIAVTIVAALRIARTVSEPIVRIAEAAETGQPVEIGDLSANASRESLTLVHRFNTFVERIDQQQAGLRRSVSEKTVLLRELHHRVKNNLQIIASLLNLQSGEAADPRDAVLFERSRERVRSMALVHEQLYRSDDTSLIRFDLYLRELTESIRLSTGVTSVSVEIAGEPVTLSIDKAIPCGMIVNELVNNACEHAFKDAASGSVRVTVRSVDTQHIVEVSDRGCGLPEDAPERLGMTLVRTLVEQIGGTLEISVNAGTTFRVAFPG